MLNDRLAADRQFARECRCSRVATLGEALKELTPSWICKRAQHLLDCVHTAVTSGDASWPSVYCLSFSTTPVHPCEWLS